MTMSRKGWSKLSSGLLLIGIGVLFLLNQMNIVDVDLGYIFSTFWPVFIIWFGLQSLIYARGGGLWGAVVPLIIGFYFLGRNLGVVDFSFGDLIKYAIPLMLIGFGLQVIFNPKHQAPPPSPPKPDDFTSSRGEGYHDLPEPPEAQPLDSSLDEEFERRFGKQDSMDKTDKGRMSGMGGGAERKTRHNESVKGYRWQGNHHADQRNEEHGGERDDRRKYRDYIGMDGRDSQYGSAYGPNEHDPNDHGPYGRYGHDGHYGHHHGHSNHDTVNKSSFIGDVHMGKDYFQLKPTNISQFIGDTVLDLTKAQIPYGETKINISAFIGDVKVFVPNDSDVGIHVSTSSFIGDMKVLEEKRSGFMGSTGLESPYYREAGKKIRINVSVFIGDVKVNKVG
ncbi:cell wall-active antibiotics response protein LiaF [Paenibacillus lactis]|uniref:cell wall-active antibiotics response protein LiaF n=1 Tax=Paenibacillus lactis TaxID=228574 RepID=UPI00369F07F0